MTNTAANELAKLTQAAQQSEQQAQRVASVVAEKGQQAGNMARESRREKAEFGLPEGIATAVVGTALFGPAGGLLVGAAQGWLAKKEKQNLLDQAASRNEAISGSEDILRNQLTNMRGMENLSAEDESFLVANEAQLDAALKMMKSGDDVLMKQGSAMLATQQSELTQFSRDQETQRIKKETLDASLKRELDQEGYDRFTKLEDDFTQESANYEEALRSSNLAMRLLERGNPGDIAGALVAINKALDPTSVVRPEEAEAFGNLGSAYEKLTSITDKLATGQALTPKQRRQAMALVGTIQDGFQEMQLAREGRYKEMLADAEVPAKYWDNFSRTESLERYTPGELQNILEGSGDQGVTASKLEEISTSVFDTRDNFNQAIDSGLETIGNYLTKPNVVTPRGQRQRRGVN